jgi:L-ribulose-5-phosphate 4-epimerase
LTDEEVAGEYERATGAVIAETFAEMDSMMTPAVLVAGHGAFTWGENASTAVVNAVVLEKAACMGYHTLALSTGQEPLPGALINRHFSRKHGPDAYYGQS